MLSAITSSTPHIRYLYITYYTFFFISSFSPLPSAICILWLLAYPLSVYIYLYLIYFNGFCNLGFWFPALKCSVMEWFELSKVITTLYEWQKGACRKASGYGSCNLEKDGMFKESTLFISHLLLEKSYKNVRRREATSKNKTEKNDWVIKVDWMMFFLSSNNFYTQDPKSAVPPHFLFYLCFHVCHCFTSDNACDPVLYCCYRHLINWKLEWKL